MFWRGASKRSKVATGVEGAGPEAGDASGALWGVHVEFGREVVALAYPGELELFDDVVAEVRSEPGRFHGGGRLRPPVGMGVNLALAAPYVLPVVWFLVMAVTTKAVDRVADGTIDVLERATRDRLAALFGRGARDPLTLDASSGAAPGQAVRLSPAQEREVREVLTPRAVALGLDEQRASYLAEAVIGALRLRGAEVEEGEDLGPDEDDRGEGPVTDAR
ncbi:hypothetical protein [Streptosporangium sp. NPDC002721]|uniref:hypothetical protein n=1 Tax=Streptosporangium sp. NPDC002721 TaxID=3366188 RepID=UPI0036CAE50D